MESDGLDVAGELLYAGTLKVLQRDGFQPDVGDMFDLFDGFETFSGSFADIEFSEPGYAGAFDPGTGGAIDHTSPGARRVRTAGPSGCGCIVAASSEVVSTETMRISQNLKRNARDLISRRRMRGSFVSRAQRGFPAPPHAPSSAVLCCVRIRSAPDARAVCVRISVARCCSDAEY